jgi:hypothetical protein
MGSLHAGPLLGLGSRADVVAYNTDYLCPFSPCKTGKGGKGKGTAPVSIVGFTNALVTCFAVSFILSGLHGYAT